MGVNHVEVGHPFCHRFQQNGVGGTGIDTLFAEAQRPGPNGVKLGAGKGRGQTLQIAAAGMAVVGLVIAKYFILAHFVVSSPDSAELGLGYFSPALFILFLQNIGSSLSPFDALWIVFALITAWRIPAPSKVEVGQ